MCRSGYDFTIPAALVVVSLSTLLFAPRRASAQDLDLPETELARQLNTGGGAAAGSEPDRRLRSRRYRGSFGKAFLGALGGFFAGELAGFALGIPVAAAIPPESNNFVIISGATAGGALAGAGLGAGVAGDASGGNGSLPAAVLGSTTGTLAAAIPVGVVGGWAASSGATELRNVTLIAGVPLTWAGTLFGAVLGYRWSASPKSAARLPLSIVPYAGISRRGREPRLGFSIRSTLRPR